MLKKIVYPCTYTKTLLINVQGEEIPVAILRLDRSPTRLRLPIEAEFRSSVPNSRCPQGTLETLIASFIPKYVNTYIHIYLCICPGAA